MIRDILVTGGAGYIGSHLVDALVAREYRVTVLDNLEPQVHRSGKWPSYANPDAKYVKGDVRDRSVFEPLVLASQAVVHFGAAVSVGQSMYQVDRYVDVNTRGTALLLDLLVNTKHHVQKVLVASSIGVYGEGAYRCDVHGPVATWAWLGTAISVPETASATSPPDLFHISPSFARPWATGFVRRTVVRKNVD